MIGSSMVERTLRHERLLVLFGLLLVVVLAWTYLLTGAGMMREMGDMMMPMSTGPWTLDQAVLVLVMWAVMMVAMMLPSAAPMILLYATIARRRITEGELASACGAFALGYVLIWAGFSLAAAAFQFGLERAALLSPMMQTTSINLAGAVLVAAGLYQWSPVKQGCLSRCRSPLEFIAVYWLPGTRGAFLMGLRHGAFCVGCCWVLMLLLFVGGLMNITWIGGLALFVLIEKLFPAGHWIGRGAGILMVAWGVATLLASD